MAGRNARSRGRSYLESRGLRPPTKAPSRTARVAPRSSATEQRRRTQSPRRSTPPAPAPTPYERRNANAKRLGYQSYWDQRQSRVRARKALAELGQIQPTTAEVDALGVLGRGGSARDLYYATKKLIESYQGPATDAEIWAIVRIFYKPRARR